MNDFSSRLIVAAESPRHDDWRAFGLWVRLAFIGFCAGAVGVTLLVDHTSAFGSGAIWVVTGSAVTVLAARRAQLAFLRAEQAAEPVAPVEDVPAARAPSLAADGLREMPAAAFLLR